MAESLHWAAWDVTLSDCRRLIRACNCPRPRRARSRSRDDLREYVGNRLGHSRMIQAEPVSEPRDLPGHMGNRHSCDDGGCRPQSVDLPFGVLQPAGPLVHHRVGDQVS